MLTLMSKINHKIQYGRLLFTVFSETFFDYCLLWAYLEGLEINLSLQSIPFVKILPFSI